MDIWANLAAHHAGVAERGILRLFDFDDGRAADFSARWEGMLFDYSKTNIDVTGRALLLELAEASAVAAKRDAMFAGAKINETEGRAVLHTALRNLDASVIVDGRDVMPEVRATHARMQAFAHDLRAGRVRGLWLGLIQDITPPYLKINFFLFHLKVG